MKPTLITIWLAASVDVDEHTDGLSVHGIFNRIVLPVGATHYETQFTVFFSVTEVRVRTLCEVWFRDLSTLDVIYRRRVILDSVSPSDITDITVRVNELPVPHPGSYVFELVLGNDQLGSARLVVDSESLLGTETDE